MGDNVTFNPLSTSFDKSFANPFYQISDTYIPKNITDAMSYCEFLYYLNGTFRQASKRVARYFITELNIEGELSGNESKDTKDFLIEELQILEELGRLGDDYSCYGNAFRVFYPPFDRFLMEPDKPNVEYAAGLFGRTVKLLREGDQLYYQVTHPMTKQVMKMKFIDRKCTDKSRIRIVTLDPKTVTILHNFLTGENRYVWRFPNALKNSVQQGDAHTINSVPISMLRAMMSEQEYLFADGEVFHLKVPTIAGLYAGGWGMPETIANFREIHQIQVYRRIDEAIGLDYLVPLRLLTPTADTTAGDATNFVSLSRWRSVLRSVVETHRKDPAAWHVVPFSVKYQAAGGEGKQLSPKDLHQFSQDTLLNNFGFPSELFRGTLEYQVMPTALRVFESSWSHVPRGYNDFLKFILDKVSTYLGVEKVKATLASVKYADDMETKPFYMQLFGSGDVSRATAFKNFGVNDPLGEKERRLREDASVREMERDEAEKAEKEQMGLSSPEGEGSGGGGVTPLDTESQAIQISQELLSMPQESRRPKLLALGKSNPTLHALVKEKMEKQRNATGTEANAQVAQSGNGNPAQ